MGHALITTPNSSSHAIYIWVLDWSSYLNQKVLLWHTLSPLEQKKARCFAYYRDQEKYTVIRGLLRKLIANLLNISPHELIFETNVFGKPSLLNDALEFNISHAKDQVIYTFCKAAALGVDIEYLDFNKKLDGLAARYFSKRENSLLEALEGNTKKEAFFQGWVKKEAIIKALGVGFKMPLSSIEVSLEEEKECITPSAPLLGISEPLHVYPLKVPAGFKSALAIQTKEVSVKFEQYHTIDF